MKNIIGIIEETTGIKFTPEMLKSRKRKNVQIRNIAAQLMFTGFNHVAIAKALGKNRSTVYHMLDSVEYEIGVNRAFRELFFKLDKCIHA